MKIQYIPLRSGNLTNGMKWKISQTSSGAYKLTAKCGEASNRVLAVEQHITNNNGIYLNQINYIEDYGLAKI